jgi:hypothetical protein
VDADLDTLATALYVTTDDFLIDNPQHRPWRPRVGITPRLQDAELVTLAVLQALLGFTSEARWLRYANSRLRGLFPSAHTVGLQQAPPRGDRNAARGHRASGCVHLPVHRRCVGGRLDSGRVRAIAGDYETLRPGRVGRVRVLRVALALLLGTASAPGVRPVGAAGGIRADRRQGRRARHSARDARRRPQPARDASRSDVNGRQELLRQAIRSRARRRRCRTAAPCPHGKETPCGTTLLQGFFKPLRQVVESVNNTLKTQLDLERHAGRTFAGVAARVLQRILALTAAIWHNDRIDQSILRSLTAYDH